MWTGWCTARSFRHFCSCFVTKTVTGKILPVVESRFKAGGTVWIVVEQGRANRRRWVIEGPGGGGGERRRGRGAVVMMVRGGLIGEINACDCSQFVTGQAGC